MTAASSTCRLSPGLACLASALVLPGLGQLLTGRLVRGAVMAGLLALWLPAVLLKVGSDLLSVWPGLAARAARGEAVTWGALQAALAPLAGELLWVLGPLAAVWLWSLVDALIFWLRRPLPPPVPAGEL